MKSKKSWIVKKRFAQDLIIEASNSNSGWELHEIGALLILIMSQFNFDPDEALNFLEDCRICEPQILIHLTDTGFTAVHWIQLMKCEGTTNFLNNIEDAFEQELLSLRDPETREILCQQADMWSFQDKLKYAIAICQHSPNKRICGSILNNLTTTMLESEALSFIDDVISRDFFLDLRGKLGDFTSQFPELKHSIETLLQDKDRIGTSGELVDSDEDENGNLRGFIDDGDEDQEIEESENDSPYHHHNDISESFSEENEESSFPISSDESENQDFFVATMDKKQKRKDRNIQTLNEAWDDEREPRDKRMKKTIQVLTSDSESDIDGL